MEQKQENFKVALKKGEVGENIIRRYLESKGWIVYFPFTKDKAHYFDMLATKDKEKVIALDVKAKARFNNWAAQGINVKTYNQYMKFFNDTKIPFYLIFIDEQTRDVHLCDLPKMKNSFNPNINIIAWYLSDMKFMFNISEQEQQILKEYTKRNYDFNPM